MQAIINTHSIGIFLNNKLEIINGDHPHFIQIRDALKQNNEREVQRLLNLSQQFECDGITERNGTLYLYGVRVDTQLTRRLFQLRADGFPTDNMLCFLKNLYKNPSKRAVDELYTFLEKFVLPITEDGCFLAYKAVRNNYMDIYSGTFSNKVGDSPSVPRFTVDDDKRIGCSTGLHVGAIGYVKQYGGVVEPPQNTHGNRVMIVKVDPQHVVSVPIDSGFQKVRVCEYTVVSEMDDYTNVLSNAVYTSTATECKPSRTVDKSTQNSKDEEYFEGRRNGELDMRSGVEYALDNNRSTKYNRGYRNGYFKSIN